MGTILAVAAAFLIFSAGIGILAVAYSAITGKLR